MFLIRVANTFMEYTQCIYFAVAVISINIIFITLVLQMKELFALIDRIQQHVDGELKRHASEVVSNFSLRTKFLVFRFCKKYIQNWEFYFIVDKYSF